MAELAKALREQFPGVNILVAPAAAAVPLDHMEARCNSLEDAALLIQLASDRRLEPSIRRQGIAVGPGGNPREDVTLVVEVKKGAADTSSDQDIVAFDLSDYLPPAETGRMDSVDEIKHAIEEAALNFGKRNHSQKLERLDFAFNDRLGLLVVTGLKDDVQVARKILEALTHKPPASAAERK